MDIGWISRPRGLRGQVWVTPYSDEPERLVELREFRIRSADGWRSLRLEEGRVLGNRLSMLFEGVSTRTAAEALCGQVIQIHRRDLPPLEDDEVFLADLIGLEARLADGRVVGTVTEILELPAGPLLEIRGRGQEALVPFQRRFVPRLELKEGWLELDVPDGLLPDDMLAPPKGEAAAEQPKP